MCKCNEAVAKNMREFRETFLSDLDKSNQVLLQYNMNTMQSFTGTTSKKRYIVSLHNNQIYVERDDAPEMLKYKRNGKAVFSLIEFEEVAEEVVYEQPTFEEVKTIVEEIQAETVLPVVEPVEVLEEVVPEVKEHKKSKVKKEEE